MTPMTVSGTPFSVIVAPIAAGSPLKRRCHVWCVITTTGFTVPGALSSSLKKRPRSGFSPSTSKNDPDRERADEPLRLVDAGQVHALRKEQADRVERRRSAPDLLVFEVRHQPARKRRRLAPDVDTSRSACGYGSGRSSTALTMLNIAVLAPTPSASVRIATSGERRAAAARAAARSGRPASVCRSSVRPRSAEAGLVRGPASAAVDAARGSVGGPARAGPLQRRDPLGRRVAQRVDDRRHPRRRGATRRRRGARASGPRARRPGRGRRPAGTRGG